jgi:hypothetical protein
MTVKERQPELAGRAALASWPRRHAAALCYLALLAATELTYALISAADRQRVLDLVSTNVANLSHHPVVSVVGSAFVPGEYPLAWFCFAAVGLLGVNPLLGNRRTVLFCVVTHVVGTGVSEGIVAWRLAAGDLPDAARHQLDTGPSFLVVPTLVLTIAYASWLLRIPAVVCFLALLPYLFVGLTDWDVSATGHATVIVLAVPLYLLLRLLRPRRPEEPQDQGASE